MSAKVREGSNAGRREVKVEKIGRERGREVREGGCEGEREGEEREKEREREGKRGRQAGRQAGDRQAGRQGGEREAFFPFLSLSLSPLPSNRKWETGREGGVERERGR